MGILRIILLLSLVAAWQVVGSAAGRVNAAGTLTITPSANVAAGGWIQVQGTGAPGGADITVAVQGPGTATTTIASATVTANAQGNFTATISLPTGIAAPNPPTTYTTVATLKSNSTQIATGTFTVVPQILTLSRNPVQPGQTVTVTGNGFSTLNGGQVAVVVAGVQAYPTVSAGNFTATIPVPSSLAPGNYVLTVSPYPALSPTLASTVLTVGGSNATINLSPSSIQAGPTATTTVTGSGFAHNDQITVSYTAITTGGTPTTLTTTATTDSSGAFTATLQVPASISTGTYTVIAQSQTSSDIATATLTVTASTAPSITVSPGIATAGSNIIVAGSNFTAGADVTVSASVKTVDGQTVPLTVTVKGSSIASNGSFSTQLAIPGNTASGTVQVTASQTVAGATVSANANLNITALHYTVSVSPTTAAPGDTVTISGQGFTPNTAVSITSSPNYVSGSTTTDGFGAFSVQLPVSSTALTSVISITARDNTGISATTQLAVNAPQPTPTPTQITDVMPSFAHAALAHKKIKEGKYDTITVQGAPATQLKIRFQVIFPAGQHLKLTTSTDAKGHWSHLFHIPKNAISKYSHTAFVLLQLWNGTHSRKDFLPITLTS